MPVVLLVHCDGTNGSTTFTDVSPSAHPLTATNVTVSTTSPKFGTGSAAFAGSNSQIEATFFADFNFGSGPFTVEAQAYFTTTPSGSQVIISQWGNSVTNSLGWVLRMNSGSLAFFYSTTGTDFPGISAVFAPTLNRWYHLAADRDASNMLRIYVDGAVLTSGAAAVTIWGSGENCRIGNDVVLTRGFPGRLDEIRVVKGQAMYGGAFTPPTGPFADAETAQARAFILA